VLCLRNGKHGVIEYSEIDKDLAAKTDATGGLVFNAAHLCINTYRLDFLERAARHHSHALPYHLAFKKIHYADSEGEPTLATVPTGYKLEQFIFDVFEYADKLVAVEIVRDDEFSPLKNAAGAGRDCPETCRRDLYNLHKRYIIQAGGQFSSSDEAKDSDVEISPFVSYAGEGLEAVRGKTFNVPLFLSPRDMNEQHSK